MFSTKRSRVQEGRQSKSSPNSNSPWSGLDAVWIRFGSGLDEVWMRFGSGLDQVWIKLALIRFGWERTIESSPSLTAQLPKALRSVALRMGRLTYDIVCFPS